jgi:hypothetical protein
MLATISLSQVGTSPPQDLATFYWIVITILASTVLLLFRELRKCEQERSESKSEMQEKTLSALGEVNSAIVSLVSAIEINREQFSIVREIDRLRQEIRNDDKTN